MCMQCNGAVGSTCARDPWERLLIRDTAGSRLGGKTTPHCAGNGHDTIQRSCPDQHRIGFKLFVLSLYFRPMHVDVSTLPHYMMCILNAVMFGEWQCTSASTGAISTTRLR
jgi:hypothetical protein